MRKRTSRHGPVPSGPRGVAYPVRPGIPGQRNIARHHPPLPAGTSRPLPAGPGLREALGSSGLATDFTQPASLARDLDRLRVSPSLLSALRQAGYANAARHPLSKTALELMELGHQLT